MISEQSAWRRKRAFEASRDGFNAAPGLRNPHAQTLYGTLFRRPRDPGYAVEEWETPDDDFIIVHRLGDGRGAIAVLLHGLEGSARSPYIAGMAHELAELGYSVFVPEHRGCSERLNRARRLYHSGTTDDLAYVIQRLTATHPESPLFVCGVSLGGNQLGKWLGSESVPDAVRAAAIVSPPFDLTVSGPHLDRAGRVYVFHFLRTLIPKALAKERQHPGCLDRRAVARSRTFDAYDTHATAALHGFRDAQDYYGKVSCGQFLPAVRTPTLLLASADDPFNPGTTLPRRTADRSPYLVPAFTDRGGHVGFIAGSAGRPQYWLQKETIRFFEAHRGWED